MKGFSKFKQYWYFFKRVNVSFQRNVSHLPFFFETPSSSFLFIILKKYYRFCTREKNSSCSNIKLGAGGAVARSAGFWGVSIDLISSMSSSFFFRGTQNPTSGPDYAHVRLSESSLVRFLFRGTLLLAPGADLVVDLSRVSRPLRQWV